MDASSTDRVADHPPRRTPRTAALAALTAGSLVIALGACGTGSSSSSSKGGEGVKIGLSLSTLNNPFFVEVQKGAKAAAKAEGAELNVQDAQNDPSQQANQVQNFTSQNVKSVIINPVDSDAAAPAVKAAAHADIPVIAADRTVSGAGVKATVASDNVAGGELAARQLGRGLKGKGSILVLRGQPGTSASRERGEGFAKGMKKYPGIRIAAKQSADFDRSKGLDVTTNMLQSHPDVDAVFAENDEMALGAVKALGGKAGTKVKVVSFDGTPDGLKAVRAGTLDTTIAQQPRKLGEMAVRNAIKAAHGGRLKSKVEVPVKVVTEKNAARFS